VRWRLGGHPLARDTVITRISRWRLRDIILGYATAMAGLTAVGALALQHWGGGRPTYPAAFRYMTQALMSPGALLSQDHRPAPYYALAVAASTIAYLAPVFLLGSFVFKLFVLDPLVWKRTVTVEDRIGCGAVLVFRFYNASRHTLIGATVTVTAEICSPSDPTSVRSRPMALVTFGTERVESRAWASVLPYEPCAHFVPLAGPGTTPLGSTDVAASTTIDLQGLVVLKRCVTFHIRAEGTDSVTGTSFVSFTTYPGTDIKNEVFQQITWKPGITDPRRRGVGWKNFEGSVDLLLFVYDDLMDTAALEHVLGGSLTFRSAPSAATAEGWERRWESAGPDIRDVTGRTFTPARLTLAKAPGARCTGLLLPIADTWLDELDGQLRGYERTDLNGAFTLPRQQVDRVVITYIAGLDLLARLEAARLDGRAAIERNALERAERALQNLAPQALDELRAPTSGSGLPVVRGALKRDTRAWAGRKAFPAHVRRL